MSRRWIKFASLELSNSNLHRLSADPPTRPCPPIAYYRSGTESVSSGTVGRIPIDAETACAQRNEDDAWMMTQPALLHEIVGRRHKKSQGQGDYWNANSRINMLLFGLLLVFARSSGFPTPAAMQPASPTILTFIQRGIRDLPNPETGLCDCPKTRSLLKILWTCASTLILATWVSVHLNVPPRGASAFRVAVLRFGAMLTTILAPEATLRWAYAEWHVARALQTEVVEACMSTIQSLWRIYADTRTSKFQAGNGQ